MSRNGDWALALRRKARELRTLAEAGHLPGDDYFTPKKREEMLRQANDLDDKAQVLEHYDRPSHPEKE